MTAARRDRMGAGRGESAGGTPDRGAPVGARPRPRPRRRSPIGRLITAAAVVVGMVVLLQAHADSLDPSVATHEVGPAEAAAAAAAVIGPSPTSQAALAPGGAVRGAWAASAESAGSAAARTPVVGGPRTPATPASPTTGAVPARTPPTTASPSTGTVPARAPVTAAPRSAPIAAPPVPAAPAGGCAAALAYLAVHAAPGFTSYCPHGALGHQAETCVDDPAGGCPGSRAIYIADACPAAYMNEASNSYVLSGLRAGPIDPYGYCGQPGNPYG